MRVLMQSDEPTSTRPSTLIRRKPGISGPLSSEDALLRPGLCKDFWRPTYQQVNADGSINVPQTNAEITDAFAEVSNANGIFPGTVTRLIFTNEYVTNASTTAAVDGLIIASKANAHAMGLQVGVRAQTFGQLTDPHSPYRVQLQQLIKDVDFIMLNLYPSAQAERAGIDASVKEVADQYTAIK